MIRPLRRRHLWMVALVALVVAPLGLLALVARPAPPVQGALPGELARPAAAAYGAGVTLATTPPLEVRSAAGLEIELEAASPVEGPGLLVYWVPAAGDRPSAGVLLGALRGGARQRLTLPAAAGEGDGELVVYALGHGEEVARAGWPPRVSAP